MFLFLVDESYYLSELIETSAIGLSGFILGFSLLPVDPNKSWVFDKKEDGNFYDFWGRISFWVTPVLLAFCCIAVFRFGLTSKREINDLGGGIAIAKELLYVFFMFATFFICRQIKDGGSVKTYFLYFLGLSILALLVLGERDIFFRILFVVSLFYFSSVGRFKKRYYFFAFVGLLVALSFSQQIKSFFVTGSIYSATYSGWEWMFYNEFSSGSRNLRQLMVSGDHYDAPNLIAMDLIRFLDVYGIADGVQSSTAWFNSVYRDYAGVSGSSGWGFGIMAELYAVSGDYGVFLGSMVLSLITLLLYKLFSKSLSGRVLFYFFIAALVYSFRADFANLLGLFVKWTLIPFWLAWIFYAVLVKSGRKV